MYRAKVRMKRHILPHGHSRDQRAKVCCCKCISCALLTLLIVLERLLERIRSAQSEQVVGVRTGFASLESSFCYVCSVFFAETCRDRTSMSSLITQSEKSNCTPYLSQNARTRKGQVLGFCRATHCCRTASDKLHLMHPGKVPLSLYKHAIS